MGELRSQGKSISILKEMKSSGISKTIGRFGASSLATAMQLACQETIKFLVLCLRHLCTARTA